MLPEQPRLSNQFKMLGACEHGYWNFGVIVPFGKCPYAKVTSAARTRWLGILAVESITFFALN